MEKKRSSKKLGASVLAILLVISMMVGMVPGGMSEVHAADAKANVKAEEQTGFLDKAKISSQIWERELQASSQEEEQKLSRRQRWLRRLL